MVTVEADRIVDDYLHRLDKAAAALPPEQRSELLAEIRAHVDEDLRATDITNEVAVRNVLERLGSPEEIVSAAADVPVTPVNSTDQRALRNGLAIAALLALAVGPFVMGAVRLPGIVLILAGLILVSSSPAWSARDKRVGLLLLPLIPPTLLLIWFVFNALRGDSVTELEGVPIVLLISLSLLSAPYLGWRLAHPRA
jgi:hypothetical protein